MNTKSALLFLVAASAVLPGIASAQFSAITATSMRRFDAKNGTGPTSDSFHDGDVISIGIDPHVIRCEVINMETAFKVTFPDGSPPETVPFLPVAVGTPYKKNNGPTMVVKAKSPTLTVAIYPAVDFAVAGEIPTGPNSFEGGVSAVFGFIPAVDLSFRNTNGTGLEIGGWYFAQYATPGGGGSNLYDVHARYFKDQIGLEVGFLNDTLGNAASVNYMLLFDFNNKSLDPIKPSSWALRVGAGFLQDVSRQYYDLPQAVSQARSTVNASVSWQASYQLSRNMSFIFSTWYARDRVDDLTRFAVGLGWRL